MALVFLGATISNAQTASLPSGFGFGFQLNQYQNDFGLGLQVTSPLFVHNRLGIRVKGNFMFLEHLKNDLTEWTPYSNVSVGIYSIGGQVGENIRLYGEGGIVFLFPSSEFSTSSSDIGGYGLFGFEFFFSNHTNYFIELGGIGTGAKANKIEHSPIYSNGFLISVGFRAILQ